MITSRARPVTVSKRAASPTGTIEALRCPGRAAAEAASALQPGYRHTIMVDILPDLKEGGFNIFVRKLFAFVMATGDDACASTFASQLNDALALEGSEFRVGLSMVSSDRAHLYISKDSGEPTDFVAYLRSTYLAA